MTKNSDSQDVKKNGKSGARRRPGAGKSLISQFQWDSVDDQAQEDLIVPTSAPKRKSAKTPRRRDKDVGTMFVVSSDSYSAPKRKARPEPKLEEIADFVADVDDDEEDAFATPSYGRTKLTRNDEELVEELATKKEKPEPKKEKSAPRSRRAPKIEVVEADEAVVAALSVASSRRAKTNKTETKRGKRENVDVKQTSDRFDSSADVFDPIPAKVASDDAAKPRGEAGSKRSFLAKIKEAISTGSISRDRKDERETEPARISPQKMRDLTQNAKKILDATGVSSDKIDALNGESSQLENLTVLLESLIQANLTLIQATRGAANATPTPTPTETGERRPIRVVEDIFEVEPRQTAAKPSSEERREKRAENAGKSVSPDVERSSKPSRSTVEIDDGASERAAKPRVRFVADEDDDFDPIARWENMADDETETSETAAPFSGERGSISNFADDDFDGWDDEAAAKKKSGRFGKKTEKKSLLETASSELTAEKNAPKSESERTAEGSNETPDSSATAERRSVVKTPKRTRSPRREARVEERADADVDVDAFSETNAVASNSVKKSSKPLEKFGELTLERATLKALQAMGYEAPTPIQAGTISRIQAGVDVMGQAQTGTGKTAAFMIPIIEGVDACEESSDPLALVVAPTRELSVQIRDEAQRLAQFRDLRVVACYGGKPIASQVEKLRRGVDILIGTPGRVIDLTNRGVLSLASARWVVLDEADRMLDIGFRPDVEKILRKTPSSRQTLLFSATLAPPVVRLAEQYMRDPEKYDFSARDVSADTIEQFYLTVDQGRKFDALVKLLETQNPRQAIVFCRTKRCVDAIGRRLSGQFDAVEAIHGDLQQSKRDRIMANFRAEKTKILVATDVVGRGIDVSTVSHIINYDVPQYCDDYVHRVGRAGRMGREGVAFTLVTTEEGSELTRIEIRINRLLERIELPGFEAYSKPVEGSGASSEPDRFERKPVFGQSRRRVRRAL